MYDNDLCCVFWGVILLPCGRFFDNISTVLVVCFHVDVICRLQKMGMVSRMAIPAGIRRISGSGGFSDRDEGSGTVSPTKEAKVSAGWGVSILRGALVRARVTESWKSR